MMFGSWTAEKNVSVFCENDDNPNGPPTGDLYQGRNVARGGRFCDQRNFNMPFLHEFKLAGNYSLPLGVDIGAVHAELRRPRARHHSGRRRRRCSRTGSGRSRRRSS